MKDVVHSDRLFRSQLLGLQQARTSCHQSGEILNLQVKMIRQTS